MTLPNDVVRPERRFEGQHFVSCALTYDSDVIANATGGLANARLLRTPGTRPSPHDRELLFGFVLAGAMTIACEGTRETVNAKDAFAIPAGRVFEIGDAAPDLQWLEVTLPA
jgi:mannose-6-phosphate isomerase-like protein (cupin superfamily)